MSRLGAALLAGLLAGCGKLTTDANGVAFLEITPPTTLTMPVGGTVKFTGRALDKNGDPLDVEIAWRTPDNTISVDASGLVLGVAAGTGRVQALIPDSERLISNFFQVTVTAPASPGRARLP